MAMATITARVDAEDKKRFDQFCADVGLTTSAAVNIYVKSVLKEHKIPFEIKQYDDPFYAEPNITHVRNAVEELRAGFGTAHELIEDDDE